MRSRSIKKFKFPFSFPFSFCALFHTKTGSEICPTFIRLAQVYCEGNESFKKFKSKSELGPFLIGNVLHKLKKINENSKSFLLLEKMLINESDFDMKELYMNELQEINGMISELNDQLTEAYFNFRNEGIKEVMIEIRAGTGGAEAALFASELADLYKLYFQFKNWKYETITETCVGAHTREIVLSVEGSCFAEFSGETGIHRVQRVPETDSQGRIHTSTVSVAVIPGKCPTGETEIINEKEVRMDVYRSSGPGGQNVNKTNSAVRLVHIPTGITVCMQDERSQIENRTRAFKVLHMRLEERSRNLLQQSTKAIRDEQIGSSDRSEKIRTYNFPQSRLTDHRISWSAQNLASFFRDPSILDELVLELQHFRLKEVIESFIKEFECIK